MISVQNLQQRLSGNKSILILILLFFTLQSCSVFEDIFGGNNKPTPPPPIEETEKSKEEEKTEDISNVGAEPKDTTKKTDPIDIKEQVHIAVILPFQLDQIDRTGQFDSASETSFEFYKGIKYAIDELSFDDVELNIHVFDNIRDKDETLAILKQKPFPDVELVIGPLYSSNMSTVAEYAKKHKIRFISPLSSSEKLATDNDFIISANATKQTRYELLINFIQNEFIDANVGIIYQPNAGEESTKNKLMAIADKNKLSVVAKKSEGLEMFSVSKELLQKDRENVIIVPADDDREGILYMDKLLEFLEEYGAEYKINVIGISEWNGIPQIAPKKYPSIQFYILDRYFINENDTKRRSQLQLIRSKNNGVLPHIYTIQAYDLMNYLGELVEKYGKDFSEHIQKNQYEGLQTVYKFDELIVDNDDLFVDNKHINILLYRQGKWHRVN